MIDGNYLPADAGGTPRHDDGSPQPAPPPEHETEAQDQYEAQDAEDAEDEDGNEAPEEGEEGQRQKKRRNDSQERINHLTRNWRQTERQLESERQERQQLQQRLAKLEGSLHENETASLDKQISEVEGQIKRAVEEGDGDSHTKAMRQWYDLARKRDQYAQQKPQEEEPEAPAQQARGPRTWQAHKWIQDNSHWFGVDQEATQDAVRIDQMLHRKYAQEGREEEIGGDDFVAELTGLMARKHPYYVDSPDTQPRQNQRNRSKPPSLGAPSRGDSRKRHDNNVSNEEQEILRTLGLKDASRYIKQRNGGAKNG